MTFLVFSFNIPTLIHFMLNERNKASLPHLLIWRIISKCIFDKHFLKRNASAKCQPHKHDECINTYHKYLLEILQKSVHQILHRPLLTKNKQLPVLYSCIFITKDCCMQYIFTNDLCTSYIYTGCIQKI